MIHFPLGGLWSFWDFQYSADSNPIEDWYQSLSEEARDEFDALLKANRKTESHLNWLGFRKFLKGKLKPERIWELEFHADKRAYRVLGKFGASRKQAIFLIGCYHKGGIYTPTDALDQAVRRARILAERKLICERQVQEDI